MLSSFFLADAVVKESLIMVVCVLASSLGPFWGCLATYKNCIFVGCRKVGEGERQSWLWISQHCLFVFKVLDLDFGVAGTRSVLSLSF